MSAGFAVLSLGGGVQSSTLAEMACDGTLGPLRAIVFADTGGNCPRPTPTSTTSGRRAEQAGIEFRTVTAGDLRTDLVAKRGRGGQPNLPVRIRHADGRLGRLNHYRCSFDYKRRPITRTVKRLCGPPGTWKHTRVEQWIGYSTDEATRIKTAEECRCGPNRTRRATSTRPYLQIHTPEGGTRCGCTSWQPWQVNRWPLIDLGMTRDDCATWLREHERPLPPRSACWFCPNHAATHFAELKHARPALFAQAVALDEFLRHGINGLHGQAYLHPTGQPLTHIDNANPADGSPGPDATGMDCEAGVCFT